MKLITSLLAAAAISVASFVAPTFAQDKGMVGISTNKNLLVHYTLGTPSHGGDQFPDRFLRPHERFLIGLERWCYDHLLAKRKVALEYLKNTTPNAFESAVA